MVTINRTRKYHRNEPIDLMTEYTICESLASVDSPYMIVLDNPRPYGAIVGDILKSYGILTQKCTMCEVGGGYGSLMRGLLEAHASSVNHVCMIDLSRFLLERQKRVLTQWSHLMTFVHADAMELIPAISHVDVIILNEIIGDLDTWEHVTVTDMPEEVVRFVDRYGLEVPRQGAFNFNAGAVALIEDICGKGIPVFVAEHASDPVIPPDMAYLGRDLDTDGFPREIRLRGHSEYTIRFSHLIRIADFWGRTVIGGSLIDLVAVKKSQKMRFIFISRASATAEQEIILEFLDHIREYRWLAIV
ncbi:MAG: class I SAM-dependent methyltransferase [Deltaproteobacteria bacterium]|nr:class I SAM-dependent methyltransferase [Deltaproteobacteria bacterium]